MLFHGKAQKGENYNEVHIVVFSSNHALNFHAKQILGLSVINCNSRAELFNKFAEQSAPSPQTLDTLFCNIDLSEDDEVDDD